MPETIQIYVCADNCMRGVVLTATEMNAADRFSYVIIEEDDLLNGKSGGYHKLKASQMY